MQNVLDIAKYIVYKHWKDGIIISNLRLQKILYYVQGYATKRCNEAAFGEAIYRWPYGPVVPEAYFAYNKYRSQSIPEPYDVDMQRAFEQLRRDPAVISVIDSVVQQSYQYSSTELVGMTHMELPWQSAEDSRIIPLSAIQFYFSNHDPLKFEGATA